jgi:hypothetical protein
MWHQKDKVSLSESFLGWLMGEDPSQDASDEARVIEVRLRIIKTLKQHGVAEGTPLLCRIARAPSVEDLWYLRPEIMQTLSSLDGETLARSIMKRHITPLFVGSLSTQLFRPPSLRATQHTRR